ncbi:MAG: hypothetical protein HPY52_14600 [Firmicutes bacterium]|nr:hypothetical protein [Bacillota bacterium]
MKRKTEFKLVPFRCGECGRLVVWALSGARAWCTGCRRWVTADEGLQKKAAGGNEYGQVLGE